MPVFDQIAQMQISQWILQWLCQDFPLSFVEIVCIAVGQSRAYAETVGFSHDCYFRAAVAYMNVFA